MNKLGKAAKTFIKKESKKSMKGFIWDPFTISIFIFVLFIALPIISNIGLSVTTHTTNTTQNPGLNATQIAFINNVSTGFFDNTFDVIMIFFYFMLILASFISAGYEGANPAATLLLGIFFVLLAEIISFGISDAAQNYITNAQNLNVAPHVPLTTYLMEYLPVFNGILTLAYMIYVITKKEVVFSGGGGYGQTVST